MLHNYAEIFPHSVYQVAKEKRLISQVSLRYLEASTDVHTLWRIYLEFDIIVAYIFIPSFRLFHASLSR